MAQIISNNSHDYFPFTIIPVIASFDREGHIKPLYVGLHNERYKVVSYWIRRSFVNQIEFNCKLQINDCLQPLIITYYMKECMWTINASDTRTICDEDI